MSEQRPAKPRPDFPLFAHRSGQWAKKIQGRVRYFGSWRDDNLGQRALAKYMRERDYLFAGVDPPAAGKSKALTVGGLCNEFLAAKDERVESGELSARGWDNYRDTASRVTDSLGRETPVGSLVPADFSRLRRTLAAGRGIVSLGNHVRHARMIFRWAYEAGLVDHPIRLGTEFREPSRAARRRDRSAKQRERGDRSFSREELTAILAASKGQLRTMILLGINCGFGATDCATITHDEIDLNQGWIDFPRPKTGTDRRCPLWPETIESLRPYAGGDPGELVFRTGRGNAWVRMVPIRNPKPRGATHCRCDSVGAVFRRLLKSAGIHRHGINFYALRHTLQTVGSEAGDDRAVAAIMGHVDSSMSDLYRERFPDSRLLAVSNHVRDWLLQDFSKKS